MVKKVVLFIVLAFFLRASSADASPTPLDSNRHIVFNIAEDAPDRGALIAMLARFPAKFWSGDKTHPVCSSSFDVRELTSDADWKRAGEEIGENIMPAEGVTRPEMQVILVRAQNSDPADETIAHELAHVVYEFYLTHGERMTWAKRWREDCHAGRFVSSYALSDAEEGFCEAVRVFLSPNGLSPSLSMQDRFIAALWQETTPQ